MSFDGDKDTSGYRRLNRIFTTSTTRILILCGQHTSGQTIGIVWVGAGPPAQCSW